MVSKFFGCFFGRKINTKFLLAPSWHHLLILKILPENLLQRACCGIHGKPAVTPKIVPKVPFDVHLRKWTYLVWLYLSYLLLCRKIRLIESNAKCRYLKNRPVKGLWGRCFICLPILPPPPYTLYSIRVNSILIQTGKGGVELTREKVRGAVVHNRPKIPTWLTASPVYKLY
jgi:hypothetical protein